MGSNKRSSHPSRKFISNEPMTRTQSRHVSASEHLYKEDYFRGIEDAWLTAGNKIEQTINNLNALIRVVNREHHTELNDFINSLRHLRELPTHKGHRDKEMSRFLHNVQALLYKFDPTTEFAFKINTSLPRQGWRHYSHKRQQGKIENINVFISALDAFNFFLNESVQQFNQDAIQDISIPKAPSSRKRPKAPRSHALDGLDDNIVIEQGIKRENDSTRSSLETEKPAQSQTFLDLMLWPLRVMGAFVMRVISAIKNSVSKIAATFKKAFSSQKNPRPQEESLRTRDLDLQDKAPILETNLPTIPEIGSRATSLSFDPSLLPQRYIPSIIAAPFPPTTLNHSMQAHYLIAPRRMELRQVDSRYLDPSVVDRYQREKPRYHR